MRPNQRKAILMLFDVLNRDLPAFNRMAVFAFGSQLPAMNISMAIGAAVADIGKNQLGMALSA